MALTVLGFPGCCTAKVITGFGGTHTAQYGYSNNQSEADMKDEIARLIRGPQLRNMGLVFATCTSQQTKGIKVLTEMGFKPTEAAKKNQHSESDLIGFTLGVKEWLSKNGTAQAALPKPLGMVKDLTPGALRRYRANLNYARLSYSPLRERYREEANAIRRNPANYLPGTLDS